MSNLAKKKSPIWKHFAVISSDKAKCEYCSKVISYSGGGSGNLTRHMKKLYATISIEPMILPPIMPQMEQTNRILTPLDTNVNFPSTSGLTEQVTQPSSVTRPLQTTIETFARSARPLPLQKTKQLDEQIVQFIVKGYHPFSIVEEE